VPNHQGIVSSTTRSRRRPTTSPYIEDIAMLTSAALFVAMTVSGLGHHAGYASAQCPPAPSKCLPAPQAPCKAAPCAAPSKCLPAPQAPCKAAPCPAPAKCLPAPQAPAKVAPCAAPQAPIKSSPQW
jgi:hypothetical protein